MLVEVKHPVPSDIEIAQEAKMRPIIEVAAELGLTEDDLDLLRQVQGQGPPGCPRTSSRTAPRASTST